MGQLQVPREPTTYEYLEFPDNSNEARTLRTEHPVVMAFEEKYEGVSWRARLNG